MKNKNLLIIGAVVIAAIFFLKKKKTTPVLPVGPILPGGNNNLHPIDMLPQNNSNSYPGGLTEGMRVLADNGVEQQILENGYLWGLTYDQWAQRGFDAPTIVNSSILNQIPYGGVYKAGI